MRHRWTPTSRRSSSRWPRPGRASMSCTSEASGTPVRRMVGAGFAAVPFVSTDGILDGSGSEETSFVHRTGASGAGSYSLRPSLPPVKADFAQRFQERFGVPPDDYAGAAYACAQVILQGL